MDKECKIAELGMMDMLYEIKNPLTNIRLALELLESGNGEDPTVYYTIIKNSAIDIEGSIKELCNSFSELGFTLHITPDPTMNI